jgi:hypothetical protein
MNLLVIEYQYLVFHLHYRIQYNHLNDLIILIIRFLNFVMNPWKIGKFYNDQLNDDIYYYLYSMESIEKKKL